MTTPPEAAGPSEVPAPAPDPPPSPAVLHCGSTRLDLGRRTYVMGVVNITPDSFSDGGRFLDAATAYDHAMRLAEQGADIIDLGAESTRPAATPISAVEELRRLVPVLERLAAAGVDNISVDTYKAAVACAALQLGAAWINDVSGMADPSLAAAATQAQAFVVMHARPMNAARLQDDVRYGDVVSEVSAYLDAACARACAAGVRPETLIVDPGIGFGKSAHDNVTLLDRVGELRSLGRPILVGPSRKRFLRLLAGVDLHAEAGERDSPEAIDIATAAACCLAALRGADIVRVHNVAAVRSALAVIDATRQIPASPPASSE